jgi:GT2 family glycosyltransferase
VVIVKQNATSIAAAYNSILDSVDHTLRNVEGVVLLHQDLEIRDESFISRARSRLNDPSIGLMGVIGARQIRSIAYWRGDVRGYVEEDARTLDFGRGCQDVHAIDGMLMILAPPVFSALRFDESVARRFHGYDIDFSFQVRQSGLRVVVEDLPVVHHTKGGYGDRRAYLAANRAWRRKWLRDAPLRVRIASWLDEVQVASGRDRLRLRSRWREWRSQVT